MGCGPSKCCACACCGCCISPGSVLYDYEDDLPIQQNPAKHLDAASKIVPCLGSTLPCAPAGTIGTSASEEDENLDADLVEHPGPTLPCFPGNQPGQALSCFGGAKMLKIVVQHLRTKGFPLPAPVIGEPGNGLDPEQTRVGSDISSIYDRVRQTRQSDDNAADENSDVASFVSIPTSGSALARDSLPGMHGLVGHAHGLAHADSVPLSPKPTRHQRQHQHAASSVPFSHFQQTSTASHQHHHLPHHVRSSDHPALEAFKRGALSFAFSGGGFFFPYHLGIVIQLKDMGIITDRTPLAGASCGSIIVSCVNAGMDLHGLVGQLLEFAADCRTFGTAGRLRSVIEKFMTRQLPPDAAERCRGKTFISLTKVFPFLRPLIVSDYTTKEDLVQAIATSCHIPAYNDGSFMAVFRGQYFVDGGLVRHIPAFPHDVAAGRYVAGVSCVPFKFLESLPGVQRLQLLKALSVSPDMFHTFPFGWHEVGGLVLAPAEDPVLLQMVEMGKRDIATWAAAVGLTAYLSGSTTVPRHVSHVTAAAQGLGVAGGVSAHLHHHHDHHHGIGHTVAHGHVRKHTGHHVPHHHPHQQHVSHSSHSSHSSHGHKDQQRSHAAAAAMRLQSASSGMVQAAAAAAQAGAAAAAQAAAAAAAAAQKVTAAAATTAAPYAQMLLVASGLQSESSGPASEAAEEEEEAPGAGAGGGCAVPAMRVEEQAHTRLGGADSEAVEEWHDALEEEHQEPSTPELDQALLVAASVLDSCAAAPAAAMAAGAAGAERAAHGGVGAGGEAGAAAWQPAAEHAG